MNSRMQDFSRHVRSVTLALALVTVFVATVVATPSAQAQTFTSLYSFSGKSDGGQPAASLILDTSGNLYGTTASGGTGSCTNKGFGTGCGTVFAVNQAGKETVIYSFPGTGAQGANPLAYLVRDTSGNLYGTTQNGGSSGCNAPKGCGVVFRVTKAGKEVVFHSFAEGSDGAFPGGGLIRDSKGNLYGLTGWGGSEVCSEGGAQGCGTVFKLTPTGTESVLYDFTGAGGDGAIGSGGLIEDAAGNLYGTTEHGGNAGCDNGDGLGCGTVFKLSATGTESVLYAFEGGSDGANPYLGSLIEDAAGNLYGTTAYGGDLNCNAPAGCGTVFALTKTGKEIVLYTFTGADGAVPLSALVRDPQGNLYGTTAYGGDLTCNAPNGCGTVFEVTTARKEVLLHIFESSDGLNPYGGLVRDTKGNLYGTTFGGGTSSAGTVFKLTP